MPSLTQVIADLQALDEQLGDVSNIKEQLSRAKADLESMNNQRDHARAEMQEAQGLLTKAQADAQRRYEQDMFNKQGALRDLTERVKALEEQATKLRAEVAEHEQHLAAISTQMRNAKAQLANW